MYQIKPKKKRSFLYGLVATLCLGAIGCGILYANTKEQNEEINEQLLQEIPTKIERETENLPAVNIKTPEESEMIQEETKDKYLVKLEGNKTNVYKLTDGNYVFSHTLPVFPDSLRKEDLQSLIQGIYLLDRDALLSFTEDFCS